MALKGRMAYQWVGSPGPLAEELKVSDFLAHSQRESRKLTDEHTVKMMCYLMYRVIIWETRD